MSCVNGSAALSLIHGEASTLVRFAAPQCERRRHDLAEASPAFLTPVTEAPCAEVSSTPSSTELPNGVAPMTWMKTRPELFDEMAADDLSETAALAHLQGLGWLYRIEHDDCLIPRRLVAKILTLTPDPMTAVAELCAFGYWVEEGKAFRVVHDAGTVRQSLAAQWAKREKDARGKANAKAKRESEASAPASMPQPNNLTTELPAVREKTPRIGTCSACQHREPLDGSGRCESCVAWNVREAS